VIWPLGALRRRRPVPLDPATLLARHIPSSSPGATHFIDFQTTRLPDGALRPDLLRMLRAAFGIGAFVESGTHRGDTTWHAASVFAEVHTVERSRAIHRRARERFRDQPHVRVHRGDSGRVFRSILPAIRPRILFYLDGHALAGGPLTWSNTPILRELASIGAAGHGHAVIAIDDIRCFQDSRYPRKIRRARLGGYPDLDQLLDALFRINPAYQVCFLGDALLAFPLDPTVAVSDVVRGCAVHRIASRVPGFPETVLDAADRAIRAARGTERDELVRYDEVYSAGDLELGYRSFGTVWVGLVESSQGQPDDARTRYRRAAAHSPPGWRADQLLARDPRPG